MERKYNFYNVTYEYCKDDYPALYHTLDELTEKCPLIPSPEDGTDPIATFKNLRDSLNSDFLDILKIFSVEGFFNDFKENGAYLFNEQDVTFLATVLHHYRQEYVWKKDIKRLPNYPIDKRNCIQIYQESKAPEKFAEEVDFTARGLLAMYQSLETVSESSKEACKQQLIISSQYPTLNLHNQCIRIAQDICALYPIAKEVNQSINGILLLDYADLLDKTLTQLKLCVSESRIYMEQLKEERQKEYYQWLNQNSNVPSIVSAVIDRINRYVSIEFPDYSFTEEPNRFPQKTNQCKEVRNENCRLRERFKEAIAIEAQEHNAEFNIFAKYYHII